MYHLPYTARLHPYSRLRDQSSWFSVNRFYEDTHGQTLISSPSPFPVIQASFEPYLDIKSCKLKGYNHFNTINLYSKIQNTWVIQIPTENVWLHWMIERAWGNSKSHPGAGATYPDGDWLGFSTLGGWCPGRLNPEGLYSPLVWSPPTSFPNKEQRQAEAGRSL